MIYLFTNELLLIAALTFFYVYLRAQVLLEKICFPAFVSLSTAIFNPVVILLINKYIGLYWWRSSPYWTLFYGVAAVVAGHVAMRRIKSAPSPLRGRAAAVAGLTLGYAIIGGGVLFLLWLGKVISGMSPV